ncbi:MAG: hypothetical protein ABFD21_08720 [Anaerolineaceae bacterium]
MPDKKDLPRTSAPQQGEIQAIVFGEKVITVKDKCSCGGAVHVLPDPATGGKVAKCVKCGAELKWGGK